MRWAVILANVCGWPIIQLSIAWGITLLSPRRFVGSSPLDRVSKREEDFYREPSYPPMEDDAARWHSMGRRYISSKEAGVAAMRSYLSRFVAETRRGELAHWIMMACVPVFFLWNPAWVWPIMVLYAIAANIPCIVVQRYNRAVAFRLLSRYSARTFPSSSL